MEKPFSMERQMAATLLHRYKEISEQSETVSLEIGLFLIFPGLSP